jgi:hypothetical protein
MARRLKLAFFDFATGRTALIARETATGEKATAR